MLQATAKRLYARRIAVQDALVDTRLANGGSETAAVPNMDTVPKNIRRVLLKITPSFGARSVATDREGI
jgi:hypothetical protein